MLIVTWKWNTHKIPLITNMQSQCTRPMHLCHTLWLVDIPESLKKPLICIITESFVSNFKCLKTHTTITCLLISKYFFKKLKQLYELNQLSNKILQSNFLPNSHCHCHFQRNFGHGQETEKCLNCIYNNILICIFSVP